MTARCLITVPLLTGDCAARGVGVRARESLATGVGASFRHRCFPTLARARPAGGARCGFLDPYGAAMSLDTRLGSWGGAMSHGGVAHSARQVSIETAAKLPAIPRRGSGGYPSEGHMRIELRMTQLHTRAAFPPPSFHVGGPQSAARVPSGPPSCGPHSEYARTNVCAATPESGCRGHLWYYPDALRSPVTCGWRRASFRKNLSYYAHGGGSGHCRPCCLLIFF